MTDYKKIHDLTVHKYVSKEVYEKHADDDVLKKDGNIALVPYEEKKWVKYQTKRIDLPTGKSTTICTLPKSTVEIHIHGEANGYCLTGTFPVVNGDSFIRLYTANGFALIGNVKNYVLTMEPYQSKQQNSVGNIYILS